tara:strand:+ start:190 stop:417 length:228 start_codon:yes stop_codon:yes gene_type:complete
MSKLNTFMKKWIREAIEDYPEPFTSRDIFYAVLDARPNNSHYITNVYSVGMYLNVICEKEKLGKKNVYRRKKNEN